MPSPIRQARDERLAGSIVAAFFTLDAFREPYAKDGAVGVLNDEQTTLGRVRVCTRGYAGFAPGVEGVEGYPVLIERVEEGPVTGELYQRWQVRTNLVCALGSNINININMEEGENARDGPCLG